MNPSQVKSHVTTSCIKSRSAQREPTNMALARSMIPKILIVGLLISLFYSKEGSADGKSLQFQARHDGSVSFPED